MRQEAQLVADVPRPPARGARPLHPRGARLAGRRPALRRLGAVRHRGGRDRGRGGAAPGHAHRRAQRRPAAPAVAVARVGDTDVVSGTLRGKVEFEADGEGREVEILDHLLRRSVAETWRSRLGGLDLAGFVGLVAEGEGIATGDAVPSAPAARPGRHRARAGRRAAAARGRRRPRARRRPPRPSSSRSRACTSPGGWPRTCWTTAARSTAAGKRTERPLGWRSA